MDEIGMRVPSGYICSISGKVRVDDENHSTNLSNLDTDEMRNGVNSPIGTGSLAKRVLHKAINHEATLHDAHSGLGHDSHIAGFGAIDEHRNSAWALDVGSVNFKARKMLRRHVIALRGPTLIAVLFVDQSDRRFLEICAGHVPVLQAFIRVAHAVDVGYRSRGVHSALRIEKRLQWAVGGNQGTLGRAEARLTIIAVGEGGLRGLDVLPVSPETVDVRVVKHTAHKVRDDALTSRDLYSQKRVEPGKIGLPELLTA